MWKYVVRDFHLWVAVRNEVMMQSVHRGIDLKAVHAPNGGWRRLSPRLLPYHLRTLRRLATDRRRYDAVIFKLARNYSIYRYYDERLGRPLIVESSFQRGVSDFWNRHTTYLMDSLVLLARTLSPRVKLTAEEERTIEDFVAAMCEAFRPKRPAAQYVRNVTRSVKRYVIMRHLLKRFVIDRLKGRLALVHQAYYLSSHGIFTSILREHGIYVAEPQHGAMHPGLMAYTYPQAVIDDPDHPVHRYRPDVFLTFGAYWNDRISIPGPARVIGYPHLTEKSGSIGSAPGDDSILIVSQGAFSELMIETTQAVAAAYPDTRIVFKLHPGEFGFKGRYDVLRSLPNVDVIDYPSDIHAYLARCRAVIGINSTVLYEAVAYPEVRIFLMAHDLGTFDEMRALGTVVPSVEALIPLLDDPAAGRSERSADDFWESDWEANIDAFLAEFLDEGIPEETRLRWANELSETPSVPQL